MVAIAQSGDLASIPLPQLLLDLYRARFDGRLVLIQARAEKNVLFQKGEPVVAESNLASESLGVRLMDMGRISREDHTAASAHMQAKNCKEGVALLDLGLIEPKELFAALKEQVRSRIIDCFAWPNGRFETDPSDAAPEGAQPFRADVFALVQEGLETHWSTERILGDLAEHLDLPVRRSRRLGRIQERLRWDDGVQAFIDSLDGEHSLWQAFEVCRSARAQAAAWVLHTVHAIDYPDPNVSTQSEAEPAVEIVLTKVSTEALEATPASAAAGKAAAVVDTQLMQEIEQKFEALGQLDHYMLLGVEGDVESAEIRSAYLDAAKRFHPDALARAGLDNDVRTRAGKIFAAIGRAHRALANNDQRRAYDKSLALDETDLDTERLAAAKTHFRKAEVLLRQGNYRGALDFLQPAVDLWPEEPEYQADLGWAHYRKNPPDLESACKHLEIAHQLAPDDPKTAGRLETVRQELG